MSFIIIDKESCKSCGLCIKACPKGVIATGHESNKSGYFSVESVNGQNCIGCTLCAVMCPDCAITVEK